MTKDIGWQPPAPPEPESPFKGLGARMLALVVPLALVLGAYLLAGSVVRL